jgi:hypothetical protein
MLTFKHSCVSLGKRVGARYTGQTAYVSLARAEGIQCDGCVQTDLKAKRMIHSIIRPRRTLYTTAAP